MQAVYKIVPAYQSHHQREEFDLSKAACDATAKYAVTTELATSSWLDISGHLSSNSSSSGSSGSGSSSSGSGQQQQRQRQQQQQQQQQQRQQLQQQRQQQQLSMMWQQQAGWTKQAIS